MKPKLFVLSLYILLIGCKSNESVLLRLKYNKDADQAFAIKIHLTCSSSEYIKIETHAHLSLDSVGKNSLYFLTAKVDAIKNDIEFGGLFPETQSVHYDSQKSYADMSYEERGLDDKFDALMSNYYHLTLDQSGNVISPITIGGKPTDQPFGISIVQLAYPGKKVKVGDTWTFSLQNPLKTAIARLLSSNYTFTYTIDDIKKDIVLIDVDLRVQSGMSGKSEASGYDASGVYTVDRNTGQLITGYIKMPIEGCGEALISVVKE